jgi:hypothetical protein
MTTATLTDLFGPPISTYTRAQAIADGVLVDLSALAPDVCRQHYKVQVACTAAVWGLIEKAIRNPRHCNDLNGVVHDVLWMSRVYCSPLSPTTKMFRVTIKGAGRRSVYDLRAVCGPADDASPCLTIMLPEEDS